MFCDHLSDDVENEEEYNLSLELMNVFVEKAHKAKIFSQALYSKVLDQIKAVDEDKEHVANYFFKKITHLFKRTTTANECHHRNIKYGEGRVAPNNSLAESAAKLNARGKASVNRKRQAEAAKLKSTPTWAPKVSCVLPHYVICVFCQLLSIYFCLQVKTKSSVPLPNKFYHRCQTNVNYTTKHKGVKERLKACCEALLHQLGKPFQIRPRSSRLKHMARDEP